VPDIQDLAQRAAQRALGDQGQKALGKFLGNKGLGKILGGSGNSGKGSDSNPLNNLKNLF